jgi:urease accessory protein
MADPDGLNLRLQLLIDSRAPAGAHGHSAGIEPAVAAGIVTDLDSLRQFCAARLETTGLVTASFAALAARAQARAAPPPAWAMIDDEIAARIVSPAARTASRALGRGLWRLVDASLPGAANRLAAQWANVARPAPHHPLVLGAAAALVGASPLDAARAAAGGVVSLPASAALRLLGLDPYLVQAVHHHLIDDVERIAALGERAASAPADLVSVAAGLPADSAPAMDILAEFHLQQEVRLFAS